MRFMKKFSSIYNQLLQRGFTKKNMLHYRWSFVLCFYLLSVFLFFLPDHINLFFAILNICFIFSILILIGKIKFRGLRFFIFGFVMMLLSINVTFSIAFSTPLSLGNLSSILEANLTEILSFDTQIYVLGIFCLLITTILSLKSISELKSKFSAMKVVVSLLALVIFTNLFAVLIPVCRNSDFFKSYRKELQEMPVQTIYAFSSLRLPLLYGDILGLVVYSIEKIEFERFKNIEKENPQGANFNKDKKTVSKIYLVIGESAWREKMSLYGYSIPTTPFLDSLAQNDPQAISFFKAISIANMTRDAVRFSLSFATPLQRDFFWSRYNVVEMAKNAGYITSWISNQEPAGLYDNYPSYIARSSDEVLFEKSLHKDDLHLLDHLKNKESISGKQFNVVHLIGSHFPYSDKYDATDESDLSINDSVTDYEKSLHHTDRFLRDLYDYTVHTDSSSLILYYSDHGASPERGIHGLKGFHSSEYEIPLVVLKNNVDLEIEDAISKYVSMNEEQYINSSNLIYILSEWMGYDFSSGIIATAVNQSSYIMLVDGALYNYDLPIKGKRSKSAD